MKRDERKVSVPIGFCERFVLPPIAEGSRRFSDTDILHELEQLGAAQVRNFVSEVVQYDQLSAMEVMNAVQNMSPQELA